MGTSVKHVVAVHDATAASLRIYVDGVSSAAVSTAGFVIAWPTTNARTWIGRQGTSTANSSNSKPASSHFGHFVYFDRALTVAEVAEHYAAGAVISDGTDYVPQIWVNGFLGGTPLSATRLSNLETGIDQAFNGRQNAAHYTIVASDAPDYMKRGPRTLVCTGTNDEKVFLQALTYSLVEDDFFYNPSTSQYESSFAPVRIAVSPGTFNFSPTGLAADGVTKACVALGQRFNNRWGRYCSLEGAGPSSRIKLVGGLNENVHVFDVLTRVFSMTGFTIDGNVSNQLGGIQTGIHTSYFGSYNSGFSNLHIESCTRGFHDEGAEMALSNIMFKYCTEALYIDGYAGLYSGIHVDSDGVTPPATGLYINQYCQGHSITGMVIEGAGVYIAPDASQNILSGISIIDGNGPGITLDGSHENTIQARVSYKYTSTGHGLELKNAASGNRLDVNIVGSDGHGVLLDNAQSNLITGIVSGNGQLNGATPIYDNVHIMNGSNANTIDIQSRNGTSNFLPKARYGVHIATADCNDNWVKSDLLDSGLAANFSDLGTTTVTTGNRS
jgi:hypothetical protein